MQSFHALQASRDLRRRPLITARSALARLRLAAGLLAAGSSTAQLTR